MKYGPLPACLAHHYADNDRPRLSTPGGSAKAAGLRYFYRKHRGRMSSAQKDAFAERSRRLFGFDPLADDLLLPRPESSHVPVEGAPVRDSSYNCGADDGGLTLVVGAVTSPDTTRVSRLMRSLADRIGRRDDAALKVVLLENGGRDGASRAALRNAVAWGRPTRTRR